MPGLWEHIKRLREMPQADRPMRRAGERPLGVAEMNKRRVLDSFYEVHIAVPVVVHVYAPNSDVATTLAIQRAKLRSDNPEVNLESARYTPRILEVEKWQR